MRTHKHVPASVLYSHRPKFDAILSEYKRTVHSSSQRACVKIETNTPSTFDMVVYRTGFLTLLDKRGCAAVFCNNEGLQPYVHVDTKERQVRGNGREGREGGKKGGEMAQDHLRTLSLKK